MESFCVKRRKTAGSPSPEKGNRGVRLPRPENGQSKIDDLGGGPVRDVVNRHMVSFPTFLGFNLLPMSLFLGSLSFEQVFFHVVLEQVKIYLVDQDPTPAR